MNRNSEGASNHALERTGHPAAFFQVRVSVACGPPLTAGVRLYEWKRGQGQ